MKRRPLPASAALSAAGAARPRSATFDPARRTFTRGACGWAALAGLSACGGGGGGGDPASLVVPVFLYVFVGSVLADDKLLPAQVSLTLTPQNPATSSGSFISSTLRITFFTGLANDYKVTGTFSGEEFSIVVEGAASPIAGSYRGSFIDRNTVRLVPPSDNGARPILTLTRNPPLT